MEMIRIEYISFSDINSNQSSFLEFLIFNRPKKQQPPESLYTKALSSIIQGDKKIAIKHLRDVVKQDTSHIDAYLQIGNILRERGKR